MHVLVYNCKAYGLRTCIHVCVCMQVQVCACVRATIRHTYLYICQLFVLIYYLLEKLCAYKVYTRLYPVLNLKWLSFTQKLE